MPRLFLTLRIIRNQIEGLPEDLLHAVENLKQEMQVNLGRISFGDSTPSVKMVNDSQKFEEGYKNLQMHIGWLKRLTALCEKLDSVRDPDGIFVTV